MMKEKRGGVYLSIRFENALEEKEFFWVDLTVVWSSKECVLQDTEKITDGGVMDVGEKEFFPVVGIYTGNFLKKVKNANCVPV